MGAVQGAFGLGRDPYEVLGVSPLADRDEIRHAYRTLAHRLHPDVHAGDPATAARFAEATAAYRFLRDDATRRAYDLARAAAHGPRAMRAAPAPTGNVRVRGPGARPAHRPREAPAPQERLGADPVATLRTFAKLLLAGLVLLLLAVVLVSAMTAPTCRPGEWRGCKQPPTPVVRPSG
ncbi:MAG: J domain-containing protein [Planctomycetaceae bacterium]